MSSNSLAPAEILAAATEIIVRPATDEDSGFCYYSWFKAQRSQGTNRLLNDEQYYRRWSPLFNQFHPRCVTTIVCPAAAPELIYSYATTYYTRAFPILVWAHTRRGERGQGYFSRQLPYLTEPFYYVFTSPAARALQKRYPAAVYDPDLIFQIIRGDLS